MDKELEKILIAYQEYGHQVCGCSLEGVKRYCSSVIEFEAFLSARGEGIFSASRTDIETWLKHLFTARGNKSSTRAVKLSAIRSFYGFLMRGGYLSGSPAEQVPSPKFQPPSPHKFTTEELALIFAGPDVQALDGIRDLALLSLMYACGPRVAEINTLDLGGLTFTAASCTALFHGKGAKERQVKMLKTPARALAAWHAVRLSEGAGPEDALFTTLIADKARRGLRLSQAGINAVLKKYAVRVGIADVDAFVHKMRATFATDLYDAGVGVLEIAAKMGHKDVKTTMRYIAISERSLNAAVIPEKRWRQLTRGGLNGQ
ncbi:MAG: tyrosine-type recombinase/integrase [Nitrospirae bacterium]|nr:tyrosine-type recombinase/integrase [Nitrospirota bacterium]